MAVARLSFNTAAVRRELDLVRAAARHARPYCAHPGEPALWLVGDQGVYLMGNDVGRVPAERPVVYALECPPDDDHAKRTVFGGDDGVEELPLRDVEEWVLAAELHGRPTVLLDLSGDQLGLLFAEST